MSLFLIIFLCVDAALLIGTASFATARYAKSVSASAKAEKEKNKPAVQDEDIGEEPAIAEETAEEQAPTQIEDIPIDSDISEVAPIITQEEPIEPKEETEEIAEEQVETEPEADKDETVETVAEEINEEPVAEPTEELATEPIIEPSVEPQVAPIVAPIIAPVVSDQEGEQTGLDLNIKRSPFFIKMLNADKEIQDYYVQINNKFHSYRNVNIRVSSKGVSYRWGRELIAKMTFRGKTIKMYYALDVNKFDENIYFQKDCGDTKAFAEVPFCVKVKSDRGLKNALKLIEALAEEKGIEQKARFNELDSMAILVELAEKYTPEEEVNYQPTIEEIQPVAVAPVVVPVVEEPIEETKAEEIEPIVETQDSAVTEDVDSLVIGDLDESSIDKLVIIRTPFDQKMLEADTNIQEYYDKIYNAFNGYRKINIRVSNKGVSFRLGRELVSKMTFRGKTIKLYLALDVDKYDQNVYYQKFCGDTKAFEEVPFCVKVRSDRGLKNALKLIEELAKEKGIELKARVTPIDTIAMLKEKANKDNV